MNVLVDTTEPGFVENEWLGRKLAIGDEVRIAVAMPDPRCVMPSLAQGDLPRDPQGTRAQQDRRRGFALPVRRRLHRRGSDGHDSRK